MALFFKIIGLLAAASQLSVAIETTGADRAASLTPQQRLEYSLYIVDASRRYGLDPYLVAAVIWHESDFRNLPRNSTNDYGLMQVHWQRLNPRVGETWLDGLAPADLMDPRKNILAGVAELAYYKGFCQRRGHSHHWWSHYLHGPDKLGPTKYGQKVNWRYKKLSRSQARPDT